MPRSRNILRDRHFHQRREVHEHAEGHAREVAEERVGPATASIHSGRMTTRSMPTTNTPTTSSGKICLTKRHDSHSQSRSSSAESRCRARTRSAPRASATPKNLPVKPMRRPAGVGIDESAANSSVAAISARLARVQPVTPSWMFSSPRQRAKPIAASSAISTTPCTETPSSPLARVVGHQSVERAPARRRRRPAAGRTGHGRRSGRRA